MNTTPRFEVKVPIPLNRLQHIQVWLNTHHLMFKPHHPTRWVNSLYLDTQSLASYEENLSGISDRRKLRVRWYHALDNTRDARFEIKERRAGKGTKLSFSAGVDLRAHALRWPSILKTMYSRLSHEGQALWEKEHSPVLISRYLRQYYISACSAIRATLDTKMQALDQRYSARANLTQAKSMGDYVLLELKCDEQHEPLLSALLASCPLRPSRHSKYVNGIRHLTWL